MAETWSRFVRVPNSKLRDIVTHHHYEIIPPETLAHYSSHEVYNFLKAHFGITDYPTWNEDREALASYFDAPKTQWGYLLETPYCYLLIEDRRRSYCIILAYSKEYDKIARVDEFVSASYLQKPVPSEVYADINMLTSAIADHVETHHNLHARGHPRNGRIIVNPYRIHYEYATVHHQSVDKKVVRNYKNEPIMTPDVGTEVAPIMYSAFLLYVASVEGFVNLIYELYAARAIREDNFAKEKIANEKIELKIRMLPIYCPGFNTFNMAGDTWRKFSLLMKFRNRITHADLINLNYVKMIEEDTFVFYVGAKDEPSKSDAYPKDILDDPLDFLQEVKGIVDAMIRELILSMNEKVRTDFTAVMNNFEIGYVVQDDGITIVQDRLY